MYLMTTQWPSWLNRAQRIAENDKYAAYFFEYIAFILFCREMYNQPIGLEDIPVDKLVRDYTSSFQSLGKNSKYLHTTKEIAVYFETNKNLSYVSAQSNDYHDHRFRSDDFRSHILFLRNVRNNMVHGHKDFEVRSAEIIDMSHSLLSAMFAEILDERQTK